MEVEQFEQAVRSLDGYKGVVGIMGGEPTLHPRFLELVMLFDRLRPDRSKRGLWTSMTPQYYKYRSLIDRVFGVKNLNSHNQDNLKRYGTDRVYHQPILVAAGDLMRTKEEAFKLIQNCWVQTRWSSSITPKGAFFCEVAAAMDMVFDGPGGKPIVPGWWDHDIGWFQDQIDMWCMRCGAAIPLPSRRDIEQVDDISISNLKELERLGSPAVREGRYVLFEGDRGDIGNNLEGWTPYCYLKR